MSDIKVYLGDGKIREQVLYVMPGVFAPDVSSFFHPTTKKPIQFTVVFKYGVAEVKDSLGRYLVDQGLARKTKLITRKSANDFNLGTLQVA